MQTQTAAPADLYARAKYRRDLSKEVIYESSPLFEGAEEFEVEGNVKVYALTFVTGVHMPINAVDLSDLYPPAAAVLSTIANAMQHIKNGGKMRCRAESKKGRKQKDTLLDAGVRFDVKQVHEVLPSLLLESQDGSPSYRVATGHRVVWIVRCLDNVVDGEYEAPEEFDVPAPVVRADDTDDDGPVRAAPTRKRKTKQQLNAERLQTLRRIANEAPLSYGLSRSFEEARRIQSRMEAMRLEVAKSRSKLGTDAHAYASTIIAQPSTVPTLQFAAFKNATEFLTNGVQPFFNMDRTHGKQQVRGWPLDDPYQDFLHVKEGSVEMVRLQEKVVAMVTEDKSPLNLEDNYAHSLSWMHFDKIFSFERSLYYNSHLAHYHIDTNVLKLNSYNPNARSRQPNYELPERWHRAQEREAEAARTMADVVAITGEPGTPALLSDADELFDAMLDRPSTTSQHPLSAAMTLPPPTATMVPDNLISNYVDAIGNVRRPMPYRPTFPFRRLVSEVNALVTSSEMLFTACLFPFAMGTRLPDDDILHGDSDNLASVTPLTAIMDAPSVIQCIDACVRMRADENVHQNVRNNLNQLASPPMKRGRNTDPYVVTYEVARPHVTLSNILSDSAFDAGNSRSSDDTPSVLVLTDVQREERNRQIQAVRTALSAINQRYRLTLYNELDIRKYRQSTDATSDVMPEREFFRKVLSHDEPEISANEQAIAIFAEFCKNKKFDFTAEDKAGILSSADVLPKWMTDRNACLALRTPNQLRLASMRVRHTTAIKALEKSYEGDEDINDPTFVVFIETLKKLRMIHRNEMATFLTHEWKTFHDRFMISNDGSAATLAIRDAVKNFSKPTTSDTVMLLPSNLDQRPYAQFRMMWLDINKAERTIHQNMVYMERAEICAYGAFQWSADRSEPALNYTNVGPPGVGKTRFHKIIAKSMPTGVCQMISHETSNVHNIDMDIDNMVVLYEELPASLISPNKKMDASQQEIINRTKARFTSFETHSRVFDPDEESGQRRYRDCFSSQHIVTLSSSNQPFSNVEDGLKRRLMLDIIAAIASSSSEKPYKLNATPVDPIEKSNRNRLRLVKQEICTMYAYVRQASRAGIRNGEDSVNRHGISVCEAILDRAEANGIPIHNGTHRSWIREIALSLQDQYACYMGLFSNIAQDVYSDPSTGLVRWTPESVLKMVLPFSMLTKDAVIHAITLFDFLFCSREENQILISIADRLCHFSTPSKWKFKPKAGSMDEVEHEYIVFHGKSIDDIYGRIITAHRHYGEYRRCDLEVILKKYAGATINSYGIEPDCDEHGNVVGARRRAPSDDISPADRKNIYIEEHPTAPVKERYCMAVSIEFLCRRFNIKMPARERDIRTAMKQPVTTLDTTFLDDPSCIKTIRKWTRCLDTRAPMVQSIREVLDGKTLEVHPCEHPDFFPAPNYQSPVLQYFTGYSPDDVIITGLKLNEFNQAREVNTDEALDVKRVHASGLGLFLHGKRKAKSTVMVTNHSRPNITTQRTLYQDNGKQLDIEHDKNLAYGVEYDNNDPDYIAAVEQMEALGNPGMLSLHSYLIADIVETRDKHRFPDEAEFTEKLFEAIPMLDPRSGNAIPYGFPPFTYRIQRHIDRFRNVERKSDAVATNLLGQLKTVVIQHNAQQNNNANGDYVKMSTVEKTSLVKYMAMIGVRDAKSVPSTPVAATTTKRGSKRKRVEQSDGADDDDNPLAGKRPRVDISRDVQPTFDMIDEDDNDGEAMDIDG